MLSKTSSASALEAFLPFTFSFGPFTKVLLLKCFVVAPRSFAWVRTSQAGRMGES